jgi:hypothetical protein
LIQIKARAAGHDIIPIMQWKDIIRAPYNRDLQLAVIDRDGTHALAFACRRQDGLWINAQTRRPIDVRPTHWREWECERERGLDQ